MAVPVKLEIFEGPLDLLLHLIRKNEVDIHDIPVAEITGQYLQYLEVIRELNINLAGEFLVMAATLAHLKSRMLLPSQGAGQEDEEDKDPRMDLVAQLKEYMRYKEAAARLEERTWLGRDVFGRGGGRQDVEEALKLREGEAEEITAGVFDLVEAFRDLLKTRGGVLSLELPPEGISMEDRMSQLLELGRTHKTLTFQECFAQDLPRLDMVVTFLAILELMRLGMMRVYQERTIQTSGARPGYGVLRIYFLPPSEEEIG